jgi:hypothetical protein
MWLIKNVLNEEQLDGQFPDEVHGADIVGWIVSSMVSREDQPPEVYETGEAIFKHLRDNVLTEGQLGVDYKGTKVGSL